MVVEGARKRPASDCRGTDWELRGLSSHCSSSNHCAEHFATQPPKLAPPALHSNAHQARPAQLLLQADALDDGGQVVRVRPHLRMRMWG